MSIPAWAHFPTEKQLERHFPMKHLSDDHKDHPT